MTPRRRRTAAGRCVALVAAGLALLACARSVPGERQLADARRMARDCASRPLPAVQLERNELRPAVVRPGVTATHRFIYVLCLPGEQQELRGQLRTRILRDSQVVLSDAVPDYRLRPGRWMVTTGIAVPADAPDGPYQVQLDFAGDVMFDSVSNLVVRRR